MHVHVTMALDVQLSVKVEPTGLPVVDNMFDGSGSGRSTLSSLSLSSTSASGSIGKHPIDRQCNACSGHQTVPFGWFSKH